MESREPRRGSHALAATFTDFAGGQGGPRSKSPAAFHGREHKERGDMKRGSLAAEPSSRTGRTGSRGSSLAAVPSSRPGHAGSRGCSPAASPTKRPRELMGRRGSLAAAPSSRPGRAGSRGCSRVGAASPTRPPRELMNRRGSLASVRGGVRAGSPSGRRRRRRAISPPLSRRPREGHGAESPGEIRRGRERHRGRGRPRVASLTILLGRDRRSSASPANPLDRERRRERGGAPASSSSSTTRLRGRERHRHERHGPRAVRLSSSTGRGRSVPTLASQRGEERPCTGSPPPRHGNQRPLSVFPINRGQVRQRSYSPIGRSLSTPPAASPSAFSKSSCALKRHREEGSCSAQNDEAFIIKLPQELFDDLFNRLLVSEFCRLVSTSRFMLRAARSRMQTPIRIPFIGCVLVARSRYQGVVTFRNGADQIRPTVQYIESSLNMLPKAIDIVDCRNGYIVLKQHLRFFIWDPFERGRWMEIPERPSSCTDRLLAASLIHQAESCSLVLMCEFKGLAAVQVFNVRASEWRRTVTSLSLTVDEHISQPGVHCDNFAYFLTSRDNIIRIDVIQATANVIPLPCMPCLSQKILSRINGLLSCATGDVANVCVSQYENDQWQLRWKRRAPRASISVKVVGSADENGLLLVETGPDKLHVLDVEDGNWMLLQQHLRSDVFLPLEVNNPYCYPFPSAMIDPSRFVDNKLSINSKKNTRRKLLVRRDANEVMRKAINDVFESQY